MRKLLVLIAPIAVVAWPAAAGAATFKGVVVGKEGGSVLISSPTGLVRAVRGHAALGARIAFTGERLVIVGHSSSARIEGIVVRRIGTTMFLSSNRHLVAVHMLRTLASANDTPAAPTRGPAIGDNVSAQVTISGGQLDEENENDLGPSNAANLQVQATVAAVGQGTVTLTVNGQSLTVPLPAGLTLPASLVGQTVSINLLLANDDQADENDDQDDDTPTATGVTTSGDQNGSGDNRGDGGHGDGGGGGDH